MQLPSSLKTLTFGHRFNQSLEESRERSFFSGCSGREENSEFWEKKRFGGVGPV